MAEMQRLATDYPELGIAEPEKMVEFLKKKTWEFRKFDEIVQLNAITSLGKKLLGRQYEDQNVSTWYPFKIWPQEWKYQSKIISGQVNQELMDMGIVRSKFYSDWARTTSEVNNTVKALRHLGVYWDTVSGHWTKDYSTFLPQIPGDHSTFEMVAEGSPRKRSIEVEHFDLDGELPSPVLSAQPVQPAVQIVQQEDRCMIKKEAESHPAFKFMTDDDDEQEELEGDQQQHACNNEHVSREYPAVSVIEEPFCMDYVWTDLQTGRSYNTLSSYVAKSSRGEFCYGLTGVATSIHDYREVPLVANQTTWSLGSTIRFADEETQSGLSRVIAYGLYTPEGQIHFCQEKEGPFGHAQRRPVTVMYNVKGVFFRLVCTGKGHQLGHRIQLLVHMMTENGVIFVKSPALVCQAEGLPEVYKDPDGLPVGSKALRSPQAVKTVLTKHIDYRTFYDYVCCMVEYGVLELYFRNKRWIFIINIAERVNDGSGKKDAAFLFDYDVQESRMLRGGKRVSYRVTSPYQRSYMGELDYQIALRKAMIIFRQFIITNKGGYALAVDDCNRIAHKASIDFDRDVKFVVLGEVVKMLPPQ